MDDRDTIPTVELSGAAGQNDLGGSASATTRPAVVAEWALWGKDADETGYHVLRCSKGALRALDFAENITRYSPGELDVLPQYTVSWIPDANSEPEYIALGIHELAPADPRQADGRSRRDAVGREIVFVRLFCIRYADLVRYAEHGEHAVDYRSLIQAVDRIRLPRADARAVLLDLPGPIPIETRGPVRKLAQQVATLLLTGRQVCVLGAEDVDVAHRLRFIDTVMALLPYGMRATMSAATWAGSTSQDLKLRLFFLGTARAGGRLADGRPRVEDFLVEWGHPEDIRVAEGPAQLYLDWLKDVKEQAPALLAEEVAPVRFGPADIRRMVGNLPKDKNVAETLDELGQSLRDADRPAIKRAIRRLHRYLEAVTDAPAQPIDAQIDYRRRIRNHRLLVDDDRLPADLKASLYNVLLPVAFGSALTYAGYCEVEECADIPLHTALRSALVRFNAADPLPYILARQVPSGGGYDHTLAELDQLGVPAHEPLIRVTNGVAAQVLRPRHGQIVLDCALRYLRRHSEDYDPGPVLARLGYLGSVCEYIYPDDMQTQVSQLTWVLDIAFGPLLNRSDIDQVFGQPGCLPTAALEQAVTWKTPGRNQEYVRDKVSEAIRNARGFPAQAAPAARGRSRAARFLPWNWWRSGHKRTARPPGPAHPGRPGDPGALRNRALSDDSVWAHPKAAGAVVVLILAAAAALFLAVQFILLHG